MVNVERFAVNSTDSKVPEALWKAQISFLHK